MVSDNVGYPASILEPLLDRVRELDEILARHAGDSGAADCRSVGFEQILVDLSPLVMHMGIVGRTRVGKSTLPGVLPGLTGPDPNPVPDAPGDISPVGCRELIGALDELAVAALISRSSLGTPTARRIRRETSPAHIGEILRRRDQLQPGAGSEPPTAGDHGTAQVPAGQDHALDDRDAAVMASEDPDGMTCGEALAEVDTYLHGELPDEGFAKVRQHLGTCSSCLREYGLEVAVSRLVQKHCSCDPAPADLRAKVMARIRMIAEQLEP